MDFFSHLVIGFLTALVLLKDFEEQFLILAAVMAILPDADLALTPIYRITKKYYLSHRGGSHSYLIGLLISPIVAVIFTAVYGGAFILYFIIGFLFYSLHITLDLLTTSRIPIFYPFSKREYRLSVDRAVNPLVMLFSFLVVMSSLWMHFEEINWNIRFFYRNVFFIIYYLYLLYRLAVKSYIQYRLPEHNFYIPGIFPFAYFIYKRQQTDNKDAFSFGLYKKIQFLPFKKPLYEISIANTSHLTPFFQQAQIRSKAYRFFSKWDGLIPIIKENEKFVGIILFLSESYSHGSAYSLKLLFDKHSGKILKNRDGFNFIKRLERTVLLL